MEICGPNRRIINDIVSISLFSKVEKEKQKINTITDIHSDLIQMEMFFKEFIRNISATEMNCKNPNNNVLYVCWKISSFELQNNMKFVPLLIGRTLENMRLLQFMKNSMQKLEDTGLYTLVQYV